MKKILMIVVPLVVLAVGGFFGAKYFMKSEPEKKEEIKITDLTAEELTELTYKMLEEQDISTNLVDGGRVSIRFDVVLENPEAKAELEIRNSQLMSSAIGVLRGQSTDKLSGSEGKSFIELTLKNKFNTFMKEGKVLEVWVTKISVS